MLLSVLTLILYCFGINVKRKVKVMLYPSLNSIKTLLNYNSWGTHIENIFIHLMKIIPYYFYHVKICWY